jgi:3-oxoadipate enol-lactonase
MGRDKGQTTTEQVKTYSVNGIELAVEEQGTGAPIVLVHGFPLDHTMWNAQIDALAERCRVIAPDLRGFGRSGFRDEVITMDQLADDLAALLEKLQVAAPIVLCGLSMGGYVAFSFWRRHSGRLRGLILCDTRAAADTAEAAAARLQMAQRVLREGPGPLVDTMTPRLLAPARAEKHPKLIDSLRRVMLQTDPKAIAATARGMAQRADATAILPQIDCPTLVIVGELDVISPPQEMREIARAIPAARCVEIPAAGHMSPLENPAAVTTAMLEFLDGLPPTTATGTATGS